MPIHIPNSSKNQTKLFYLLQEMLQKTETFNLAGFEVITDAGMIIHFFLTRVPVESMMNIL